MFIRTGVLLSVEETLDLGTNLAVGLLDIVLHLAVVGHEGEEAIVSNVELNDASWSAFRGFRVGFSKISYKLVLLAGDVRDIHVVGGRGQLLELLAGEDVDGDKVDLGVAVLAGLGGGHVDDLAGAVLDDDVTVLAESGTLHGEGGRRTRIGGVEGHLMLRRELSQQVFLGGSACPWPWAQGVDMAEAGIHLPERRWERRPF